MKQTINAFRYENYFFNKENNNWPDFRSRDNVITTKTNEMSYSSAWCHGAPGIGISRLMAYQITNDKRHIQDFNAALYTTKNIAKQIKKPISIIAFITSIIFHYVMDCQE